MYPQYTPKNVILPQSGPVEWANLTKTADQID